MDVPMSRIARALGAEVASSVPVGGGSIAAALRVDLADGRRAFVKLGRGLPAGMLAAEAAGLAALRSGGCEVPEVWFAADDLLVLAWIEAAPWSEASRVALGRGLAAQHRVTRDTCGFPCDTFLGHTRQPNPDESDLLAFFRDHRLGMIQRRLRDAGQLDAAASRQIDALRERLGALIPVEGERPALLHGDLWTGNALADASGRAWIFDPAAHYGHREADVAMTLLFGSFGETVLDAYTERFPLAPGWRERVPLFNLYHLLNHALLFGGGYLGQAMAVVRRFG